VWVIPFVHAAVNIPGSYSTTFVIINYSITVMSLCCPVLDARQHVKTSPRQDRQQTCLKDKFHVNILGNMLRPTSKVKNLVCKSSFYHIRDFSRIRRFLSKSVSFTVANALVSSQLDYCNSLFYGITQKQSRRLQAV
jgi:hypothetical protein